MGTMASAVAALIEGFPEDIPVRLMAIAFETRVVRPWSISEMAGPDTAGHGRERRREGP